VIAARREAEPLRPDQPRTQLCLPGICTVLLKAGTVPEVERPEPPKNEFSFFSIFFLLSDVACSVTLHCNANASMLVVMRLVGVEAFRISEAFCLCSVLVSAM